MPPRSEQARAHKRERILSGATRAFAARGFHRTRVSDVARAAGVADGTVYLYFESKDELLAAVFARAMEGFMERGDAELATEVDPVGRLTKLVTLHLESLGRDRDLASVFQIDLRQSHAFLGTVSRTILRRYLEAIAGVVQEGQRLQRFANDISPMDAAKMIFGVLDELATNWVLSDRNYRLESKAPPAITLLLRGLGVTSVSSSATPA